MTAPNKAIPLDDSALGMAGVILARGPEPIDLLHLYHDVSAEFASVDQFLLTLDVLFVLGRINVDRKTRIVTYAQ